MKKEEEVDIYEQVTPGNDNNIFITLIDLGLPIYNIDKMKRMNGTKSSVLERDDLLYKFESELNKEEYICSLFHTEDNSDRVNQKVSLKINIKLKVVTIEYLLIEAQLSEMGFYESMNLNLKDLGNNQPSRTYLYNWLDNCLNEEYSFKMN